MYFLNKLSTLYNLFCIKLRWLWHKRCVEGCRVGFRLCKPV